MATKIDPRDATTATFDVWDLSAAIETCTKEYLRLRNLTSERSQRKAKRLYAALDAMCAARHAYWERFAKED